MAIKGQSIGLRAALYRERQGAWGETGGVNTNNVGSSQEGYSPHYYIIEGRNFGLFRSLRKVRIIRIFRKIRSSAFRPRAYSEAQGSS